MNILSPRRRAILREIWNRKGHCPTFQEVGQAAGLCSTSAIWYDLERLRNRGYVLWADGQARTLTLTGKGLLAAQGFELIYLCDQDGIHEVR